MIALGGALGAILAGLIAPRVFSGIYELPLSLFFVALLALWLNWQEGWRSDCCGRGGGAMMVALVAQVRAIIRTRW